MGILSALRGGVPIVFLGYSREIAELLSYEVKEFISKDRVIKKIRLYLSFSEKLKEKQTGYWFEESDFDPPLPSPNSEGKVPWEDLGSTVIVCFKSFNGMGHWRDSKIDAMQVRMNTLAEWIRILEKNSTLLIRALSKGADENKHKDELLELTNTLSAINKILHSAQEEEKGNELPPWLKQ